MNSALYSYKTDANKPNEIDTGINLVEIFRLMLPKWYFFIISLVAAFFFARLYINHTLPVYSVSSTILINEEGNMSMSPDDQFMRGMGLPVGSQNIMNQMTILSSRTLVENTLEVLPFETDFYYRTLRNKLPIYPETPVSISLLSGQDFPRNTEFEIIYHGNDSITINSVKGSHFKLDRLVAFGDSVNLPKGTISIIPEDKDWLEKNINRKFCFTIHDKMTLVRNYSQRLKVERISRDGTILRISIQGTNREKDVDFINTVADLFISLSLDKKNLEAARRIQFIDDQLVDISDSLMLTENRLQQFRSRYRVMDLSVQGQAIINQSVELENERARIAVETNYYNYLSDYLNKEVTDEVPVAPATMGITDPGLTRLVAELAELQGQLSSRSLGEMNPLQNQLLQRIKNSKEALLETLNGLIRANEMAAQENLEQVRRINSQAAALPGTERQLLGIERKFRLNDELYTFLLERRAEQQMQKASNMPDNEIIDYADVETSQLVSPNPPAVFLISWFLGLAIPFVIIFLLDFLNKTVQIKDINRLSDLSLAGKIPHNSLKTHKVVLENPDSGIAEAFRTLRSKMQFFTKDAKSPVILITSCLPEDGKTFIAINLASIFSLMGKKTVLVGFDLRKPKIFEDFNIDNEAGISTWLIGKDKFQDILQPTSFENLYVISAGPIPPNPSELTALSKTEDLFNLLRKNFDCIIIDSAPVGLVSDTYHLASHADTCLLIIRVGKTEKDILERTLNEMKVSEFKSVSIVVNDIPLDDIRYGYGGKTYGYLDQKKAKRIRFLSTIPGKIKDFKNSRLKNRNTVS